MVCQRFTDLINISNYNDFMLSFILFAIIIFISSINDYNFDRKRYHPKGDVTRVFVVLRKVTVKIGDAENWWRECRDKNRLKKAKISVRLVLSRAPFKSGV